MSSYILVVINDPGGNHICNKLGYKLRFGLQLVDQAVYIFN